MTEVTTSPTHAAAWEKAERYAGRAHGEPEVEYWLVAARGDLWGERRFDDLDEAHRQAAWVAAEGDEVRICKVTVTRTREWL